MRAWLMAAMRISLSICGYRRGKGRRRWRSLFMEGSGGGGTILGMQGVFVRVSRRGGAGAGVWRAKDDLRHAGHLCAALTAKGIATANLEYRRVGNTGGGWPGTFADVRT